jgi:hypothetical protein
MNLMNVTSCNDMVQNTVHKMLHHTHYMQNLIASACKLSTGVFYFDGPFHDKHSLLSVADAPVFYSTHCRSVKHLRLAHKSISREMLCSQVDEVDYIG